MAWPGTSWVLHLVFALVLGYSGVRPVFVWSASIGRGPYLLIVCMAVNGGPILVTLGLIDSVSKVRKNGKSCPSGLKLVL